MTSIFPPMRRVLSRFSLSILLSNIVLSSVAAALPVFSVPTLALDPVVTVTIEKYIDGVKATTLTASGFAFPMSSTWTAANLNGGVQASGTFTLDVGNSYEAATSPMTAGADYATNEATDGLVVAPDCTTGRPFMLAGYKSGDTLSAASGATLSATPPSFTSMATSKVVLVMNTTCVPTADLSISKISSLIPCTFTFPDGAIDLSTETTHGPAGVFTPGVYCSAGAMDVGGPITLNGNGTYIFRPLGALTSTAGAIVTLIGASACDVFWTPTQATTIAANTTFFGTVIDDAGITVGANIMWTGRALAFGGTVTTDTATITVPSCPAPTTPSLGTAVSYGVLASTYTNTSAGTTIEGDVGFTTGPAVTPSGTHANYGSGHPYAMAGADQDNALSDSQDDNISYTIVVTNAGPGAASNAIMTDVLPVGTTFLSSESPAGWNCTTPTVGANGTVTCDKTNVALSESASFTIVVHPSVCGLIANTAAVASDTDDTQLANNASTATTTVTCPAVPGSPLFWNEEDTTQIRTNWHVVAGARGYKVYRSADGITYDPPTVLGNVLSYTDTVVPGAAYTYKVTAYNMGGESSLTVPGKYAKTLDVVIDDDAMAADLQSSGVVSKTGTWGAYDVHTSGAEQILSFTTGGDSFSIPGSFDTQTFTWTGSGNLTGTYDVFVNYICDSSRGTAMYDVYDGAIKRNVLPIPVDQALQSSNDAACGSQADEASQPHWKLLGNFAFHGGQGRVVLVSATGNNITADAAGFEKTGDFSSSPGSSSSSSSSFSSMSSSSSSGPVVCLPPNASLAAYWKFDAGSGVTAVDSTTYDNAGLLQNGALSTLSTAPTSFSNSHALSLNGTGSNVLVSDTTGLPSGNGARTITLWMHQTSIGQQATLVSMGNGADSNQKFILQMGSEPIAGPVYLFTDGINSANNIVLSGSQIPSVGSWHHVAFTTDNVGNWAYFLDGILTGSGTFAVPINTVTNAVEIGSRHDATSGFFEGILDDVRIYTAVLGAGEIASLAAGNCSSTSSSSSSSSSSSEGQEVICHIPSGNPSNQQTLTVGSSAVAAHLEHGDHRGVCVNDSSTDSGGGGGTNGHRGNNTNVFLSSLRRIVRFLGFNDSTPPPAFGGSNRALQQMICPLQLQADPITYAVLAFHLAQATGLNRETLLRDFENPSFCADFISARLPQFTVAQEKDRSVRLAADGYPISLINPVWDLCVRGTATLADMRSNPDMYTTRSGKTIHKTCDVYRTSGTNVWNYPDDPFLMITVVPQKGKAPIVTVPKGYVVVPFAEQTVSINTTK